MARVKISEFRAKSLLYKVFNRSYKGLKVKKPDDIKKKIQLLDDSISYVIKVDEGIKKREKQGLLFKEIKKNNLKEKAEELFSKGFNQLLIEEFVPHSKDEEKYFSLERVREGYNAIYSNHGGINIEDTKSEIKQSLINQSKSGHEIDKFLGLFKGFTANIIEVFDKNYFSFLEVNPLLVQNGKPVFLDLAVEVDDTAILLTNDSWNENDFVEANGKLTPEEITVKKLADGSSASLKLKVLNPNGSIFTIFSGGGASIVLADEIGNIGKAEELSDYAEYSGGPNEEETYLFTKNILSLVKKSTAKNKVIYIAGGVANFTDIRSTFKGVIKALNEDGHELEKQKVKVYVRRGGPHQEEGLKIMKRALVKNGILGRVCGPEEILTDIITNK